MALGDLCKNFPIVFTTCGKPSTDPPEAARANEYPYEEAV